MRDLLIGVAVNFRACGAVMRLPVIGVCKLVEHEIVACRRFFFGEVAGAFHGFGKDHLRAECFHREHALAGGALRHE
ncbi:hypothetical protein D3C87_1575070 [compost metagenome]